jgi:hypothetical protein
MSTGESVPEKRNPFDLRGLAWWQSVLAVAPVALIFVGGLVGGACGVAAMLANIKIARSGLSAGLKAVTMIAVGGLAVVAWFIIATVVLNTVYA